jgi:hypothetical protein
MTSLLNRQDDAVLGFHHTKHVRVYFPDHPGGVYDGGFLDALSFQLKPPDPVGTPVCHNLHWTV